MRGADSGDRHRKRWLRVAVPLLLPGCFIPYAHSNCNCNQLVALQNRVLSVAVEPKADSMEQLGRFASRICNRLPRMQPETLEQFCSRFSGSRRARYERAALDYKTRGITRKDANVTMFVKMERLNPEKKINPDPRAIQFRSQVYCVALGRHLKPLEHYLYELKGDGNLLPSSRVIGKGLNMTKRAMLAKEKWDRFHQPCVVSLDASRFDKHVSVEMLQVEHSVYKAMNHDPEFAKLLSWQLNNKGRSDTGIKYKCKGRRMSGDMNTALGNCVIMVLMVACFMQGKKYDILDDGDDVLLFIEKGELSYVMENVKGTFAGWGFDMKIESVAHQFTHIDWCQSNPIEVIPGVWKFIRHPHKVLSCAATGFKYIGKRDRRKLLYTIGECEASLNAGVPVLQEFARALRRCSGVTTGIELTYSDSFYHRMKDEVLNPQGAEITLKARLDFQDAFGVGISQQIAAEDYFARWAFIIDGEQELVADLDSAWTRIYGYTGPEVHAW